MEYFFTDEEKALKEKVRKIAEEMIMPVRDELDKKAEFPREIIEKMAKEGLLRIFIPKEYGG
ncbi:MAG: acyl-CoA dehydrogenase family protein, partial [candidate division WOR-3 bacterium]